MQSHEQKSTIKFSSTSNNAELSTTSVSKSEFHNQQQLKMSYVASVAVERFVLMTLTDKTSNNKKFRPKGYVFDEIPI